MLSSLCYTSLATVPFDKDDLQELLTKSRAWNAGLDVTGMLLFKGRTFMQVLEGNDECLTKIFEERILLDPRHTSVRLLWKNSISERSFANWTMGYGDADNIMPSDSKEFNTFFENGFGSELLIQKKSLAKHFLLSFRDFQQSA